MRAAEASHFAKKFDDDDGALLKPQWLQRTSGAGISNQFRSADQFRGRGGRKFGGDDRRPRGPSPKVSSPASSDFPPLAPFYRSHSTGSLTPADIPSASSRLLSASKEEKTFSINRECDFPTLATAAAVVEQPARMHKSKSATALPQAISPSSDLLKAHHTTLAALAGPAVSSAPPPSAASSPALAPAVTGPEPVAPAKQTHKKKPSFSDKVSFSEIAATEKAASNKDKFQQTMANSRAELQRFKSLVPSKPVHPSLANRPSIRPFQSKVRPKMPVPTASATVLKAPDTSLMTMIPPTSPATMRKATSAPVLPMSTTLLPRSPPNPSPLSTICTSSSTPSSSSSSSSRDSAHHPAAAAAAAPSSPPRPALLSSSQSARTLPQASSASSSSDAWADETGFAPRQSFALPLASSRFSFANGTSAGGSTVSPRRRDSSPATSTCVNGSSSSSPCSSSAASPLTSPRRSSVASVMAFVQQDSDAMIGTMGIYSSSAPLSPRMATVGSSGGSSGGNALTSSSGGKTGKKPLRHSGSASSKPASNGGTRQRRRSVKSSNSSSSTNGGSRRQSADDGEPAAAANGQATVNGLGIAHYQASTCDNTASSSGSSDNASDDDQGLMLEAEYDRVNDDELMMIATGVTSITATSIAGVHLEPCLPSDDDVADRQSSQSAINGEAGGLSSLKDEFCPFSWEMRADGEEWSEFSEEAVSGFMKTLGYEAQDGGARGLDDDDDDGEGLTEEEIRLAKQQIERATLQQLLEKKKQGLSESLKNWQPPLIPGSPAAAPSAGSALASSSSSSPSSSSPSSSSTSPTLLRHHPRPVASLSASSAGGGRRGHHQPLRSSSGPTPPSSSSSHGRRNLQHSHSHSQQQQQQQLRQDLLALVDSDSDESDCEEEVHGFHGIVFG